MDQQENKSSSSSKSRQLYEIVVRGSDWSAMLLGPVRARFSDREANAKKSTASAEHDLSHSAAKAGPFTATPGGGLATSDANRSEGSWNQTVGSAKEAVGNLVGAEGLKQEGIRQNKEGQGQEAQGQLSDLGKGVKDRVGGTVGGAVAGVLGNEAQRTEAERQHEDGKARQRGVEADLQKQAPQ